MWVECEGCTGRIDEEGGHPRKTHKMWDYSTFPPKPLPDHDPRYLEEVQEPYWQTPNDAWCCRACYDDHPERAYQIEMREPAGRVTEVFLSTEY